MTTAPVSSSTTLRHSRCRKRCDADDGAGVPGLALLQRAQAHLVEPEGVGAVGGVHLVGADHVLQRLADLAELARDRLALPGERPVGGLLDLAGLHRLAPAVAVGRGLDVALAEVGAERLVAAQVAQVVQHLVPEPRVEQVQHGVLDAADVEVDAARVAGARGGAGDRLGARPHPVGLVVGVDDGGAVRRVEVAQVVPARPGPVGHRVGLAAVAAGAAPVAEVEVDVHPLVDPRQRRLGLAARVVGVVGLRAVVGHLGQLDRQHRVGHAVGDAVLVEDDRERLAPVALPAEQPVAQLVGDRRLAQALLLQPGGDPLLGLGDAEPVEAQLVVAAVDRRALAGERRVEVVVVGRLHGADDRQVEGLGEVPVALVLAGHRHDRAGAVAHQHVVGDEHRDARAGDRVGRPAAGEHPGLVLALALPLDVVLAAAARR